MPGAAQPSNFTRKAPSDYMPVDPTTGQPMDAESFSPQQLYILQSFQSQVYIQDKMDVQDEPIYDTVDFNTGDTIDVNTSEWFSNVGSQSKKTLAQTNMRRANTLISPEAQAIFQYRLKWNEDIDFRDALTIMRQFAFRFTMGTKPYQTGPIWIYSAGGGIFSVFTVSSSSFLQNGFPSAISSQALSVNLVIENEESFFAELNGNPYVVLGAPGVHMQCLLMGLHARPIR